MPELPEVETIARQLAPCLTGRVVMAVRLFDSRLRDGRLPRIRGRRALEVSRSGKRVLVRFGSSNGAAGPLWLAIHLRMSGRLIWSADGRARSRKHLRARIVFDRGALLFFDPRRFGTLTWYALAEQTAPGGVDPLSPDLNPKRFRDLIGRSRQNVKAWLLRQDRLVGLGNIYASEILHAARVRPERSIGSLDAAERRRLLGATQRILRRAIEHCGTTFSDFQDSRGVTGSYQRYLAVYGRGGEPCRRCGASIERLVQQQRSSFHCPGCQR